MIHAFSRPLLCAAIAVAAVWAMASLPFVLAGVGGGLVYVVCLFGTGFFDSADREVLARVTRKLRGRTQA